MAPQPKPVETGGKIERDADPLEAIAEMARAKAAFQPVLLYFYAGDTRNPYAKGCHKLNCTVFWDQETVNRSQKFLCLACDFLKLDKSLKIQFKIRMVPTILFTDAFSEVLYTLRGPNIATKAFHRFMDNALERNEKAVKEAQARIESVKAEFQKADTLLDECKFDAAAVILERMAENRVDADIARAAKERMEEMKVGRTYLEGVQALEAKDFDLAQVKLGSVAESPVANRWSSRAWEVVKSLPAARLWAQACADIEAGDGYAGMQKLQKLLDMDDAGAYRTLAQQKIEELKSSWRDRVR